MGDAISGAVGDAPMNETAGANETMSAVNETMSMVDGVKDFVGNVSECGLNATAEGNCTNATMPADGEMIGEDASEDADGEDATEDDGRRRLMAGHEGHSDADDMMKMAGDAMMNATDMNATDMNATMNATMNVTEMANDTIEGEASEGKEAGEGGRRKLLDLASDLSGAVDKAKETAEEAGEKLKEGAEKVGEKVKEGAEKVKEGAEKLVGKGQEVAGRVQEGAMAAVDRVTDFVCNVSDSLNGSACANATMNGTEMANDTIGEMIDEDGEDGDGEDADGEEAGDDGRRKLLDLASDVSGAVDKAKDTAKEGAEKIKEGAEKVVDKGKEIVGKVNDTARAAVDKVTDVVCNVSEALNG